MKTIFLSFRARRSSARLFCPVSRNFRFVYFGRTAKRHANKQHEIRCRDTSHSDSWTSRALTHVDILFGSFDEKICFTYGKIAHMRCEAVSFSIPFSHAKAWLWMEELLRKKKKKKLSAGFLLVLLEETEKTRMNDMNFVTFICFREAKKSAETHANANATRFFIRFSSIFHFIVDRSFGWCEQHFECYCIGVIVSFVGVHVCMHTHSIILMSTKCIFFPSIIGGCHFSGWFSWNYSINASNN